MNQTAIFWPMIAHAALVYLVYGLLLARRAGAAKAGGGTRETFRQNTDEPAARLVVRNNLANQFELPMLFHAACLSLYVTGGANRFAVAVAWIFVASRFAHAAIQVTTNRIRYRFVAFGIGFIAVGALWVALAAHLMG